MKLHRWNRRYVTGSEEKNTFTIIKVQKLPIRATSKCPQQCKSELWPLDISLEHHQAPQQSADNLMVPSHSVRRPALFLLFLYSVDQEDHVPPTQNLLWLSRQLTSILIKALSEQADLSQLNISERLLLSRAHGHECVTKASSFTLTSALCEPASHDSVVMTSQHPALSPDEMNTKQRKAPSLWRRGDAG